MPELYPYPRFSIAERDRRWKAVRALMRARNIDVINVSELGFDRRSADTLNAAKNGVTNPFHYDWRAPGWQNRYSVRSVKRRIVFGLMKLLGIREP